MYDVTTKIQIKPKNPITFPIIKVCDANFFSTEYAKQLINEYFNSSGIQNPLNVSTSNKKYIRSYLNFLRDLVKMKSSGLSKEEKKKLSMEFGKIMISCSFGNAECLPESFIWEYIDDLPANCFTFNSGLDSNKSKIPFLTSTKSGLLHGFRLELLFPLQTLTTWTWSTACECLLATRLWNSPSTNMLDYRLDSLQILE
jgi:hypothetical protein